MERRSSAERLVRKAVRDKLVITFSIAAAGGVLVAMSPRLGRAYLFLGAAIMLAAPWLSYLIILWLYRDKVLRGG